MEAQGTVIQRCASCERVGFIDGQDARPVFDQRTTISHNYRGIRVTGRDVQCQGVVLQIYHSRRGGRSRDSFYDLIAPQTEYRVGTQVYDRGVRQPVCAQGGQRPSRNRDVAGK